MKKILVAVALASLVASASPALAVDVAAYRNFIPVDILTTTSKWINVLERWHANQRETSIQQDLKAPAHVEKQDKGDLWGGLLERR